MKMKLREVLFVVSVILIMASPCISAHTNVTAVQARNLIDSTDDLIIVDVREKYEYCDAVGHIPGALNYPWNSGILQARYEELPVDSPILVVCRSGGRSNSAANFLDSKGFSMVYDMLGGMSAWQWETAPCKYAGGSGTAVDPYQISTAEDLMFLGESPEDYDKHFILTADIDLDPNLPGGKVFDRAVIAPDINDVTYWETRISAEGGSGGPLSTTSNGKFIGPEVPFGYVMGTYHEEPVLLIESSMGNRALSFDFRPPSSGKSDEEQANKFCGLEYDLMVAGVRNTLKNIAKTDITVGCHSESRQNGGFSLSDRNRLRLDRYRCSDNGQQNHNQQ